ncbi:hypothetical protein Tco_0912610 [Tanacetum coccineum]
MHEDFIATVYPKVHESLKHTNEEHVHVENPLSSIGTFSSMKYLDAFTIGDQFIDDKSPEDEPGKANLETKVESMAMYTIAKLPYSNLRMVLKLSKDVYACDAKKDLTENDVRPEACLLMLLQMTLTSYSVCLMMLKQCCCIEHNLESSTFVLLAITLTMLVLKLSTRFNDNAMYAFMVENPNGSNLLHQDLKKIHEDDLEAMDLKWQLSLLSMSKRVTIVYRQENFLNANDTMSTKKQGRSVQFANSNTTALDEDTSSKAMLAIDGVGFDWSYMAEEQCDDLIVKLNQTEFTAATYKRGLAIVEEQLITYRKNEVLFSEEVAVLKREVAYKYYEINVLKTSKDLDKLLESRITDKSKKGLEYSVVPPPYPLIYNRPKKLDLSYSGLDEFKEPEFKGSGSEDKQVSKDTSNFVESSLNVDKETVFTVDKKGESKELEWAEVQSTRKVNYNYTTKRTDPNAQRNMVPRAVLMKTGLKTFNTVRTVNTAHPKSTVFSAKPIPHFSKIAQSTVRRHFQPKTTLSNKRFTHKVNTARPKTVKTARPNYANVNDVRVNQANVVKASACKPQQDDTGFVNSRCSRHMTGNIAYLLDFKEFDGGYVTFGGGGHGGRISGKGLVLLVLSISTAKYN